MNSLIRVSFRTVFIATFAFLLSIQVLIPKSYAHRCATCQSEGAAQRCGGCRAEHYCNSTCQKAAWNTHKSSCSLRGGVKIGVSTLTGAGNGLFATRDFAQGDRVAVYYGETYPKTDLVKRLKFEGSSYLQNFSTNFINGSITPPAPHLGAQLANDPYIDSSDLALLLGVDCAHLTPEYLSRMTQLSEKYWSLLMAPEAKQLKNVAIQTRLDQTIPLDGQRLPVLIASRPIRAGDEVLYPYGPSFWTSVPQHICFRKGLPEASLDIQRAAAMALEKTGTAWQIAQSIDTSYISASTYEEQRKIVTGRHRQLIQLKNLFSSSGQVGLMSKASGEYPEQKWIDEITLALRITETLSEISQAPNSDFYDDLNYGKVHPKAKKLLHDIMDYMKKKSISSRGWFGDIVSGSVISWETFNSAFGE